MDHTAMHLLAMTVVCCFVVAWVHAQPSEPTWVQVIDHAAWAPRDSCGELVYKGRMWLLGGWFTSDAAGPRDIWSSADGKTWELVTPQAGWRHGDLPTTLVFRDTMWLMGGWYGGRKPFASASNEVWSSTDGATWRQVTDHAAWSPRLGAGGAVFDGKMWILGGAERYYDGKKHLLNDVWCSADGKTWRRVTDRAPWSPRAYHGVLAFGGKLWVFGGGNYRPDHLAYNDVWCSTDGARWERVTEHAPWHGRIWFTAAAYRDRMWLLGGWSDGPSKNWGDVWFTRDGETWHELRTPTVWSARHEQSTYVFNDQLWIVGGNPWPLVNDVWRLELPKAWERGPQ